MKGKSKQNKPRLVWLQYVCLFLALFSFDFLAGASPVSAEEKETYTIITASDYAPFEFIDGNGDLVGIDVDILEAIAKDQGFEIDYRLMPFSSGLQALESNQADGMIAGMGITPEREESFDFSDPYYEAGSMFAARGDSDIETLDDLEGKNVATKIGSAGADIANEMKDEYGFTVTTFEDSVNMYQDVLSGNSDAVIEDYPVMAYAVNTGTIDLKLVGDEIDQIPFGFAVNKGENQELLEKFNAGLANIQESGEYEEIINRYVGSDVEEVDNSFMGQLTNNFPALMQGLGNTLLLAVVSVLIALVLGIILGLMRAGNNSILSNIALVYIDLMRGLPLLVLAFFIYFGIPQLLNVNYSAFFAGIMTLGLNAAAYVAEIVRGGIQSIAKGQMEAGRSLGLNRKTTMKKIILPQAIKTMTPSLINQFVITLKDTSLLSVIGLVELTQTGRIIIARTYQSGSMWIIVGVIYVVIITLLTKLSNKLEKEML
ncbi:ABC transporter substrate-binding protein/permease [Aerococcus kribbianus]|uniref:ABC transporter substrate-binding protein/permease n=1 Tax=Aerococcus kribbianus TaxID=2999064 RepID=A0A9X3FQ27_9LACT|nr:MULTISPECIES: ABC transporter substrate-binding protein/permease [unclassified Aerococcus]MCZ0717628.1 ABC transporter substrate-binding protein/permease [Aerococcus sp. YH-aer221]MCZ0725916.1 ABC transporter substrate-binding protein/permease [Aerococcus sp. YH-aer222]